MLPELPIDASPWYYIYFIVITLLSVPAVGISLRRWRNQNVNGYPVSKIIETPPLPTLSPIPEGIFNHWIDSTFGLTRYVVQADITLQRPDGYDIKVTIAVEKTRDGGG